MKTTHWMLSAMAAWLLAATIPCLAQQSGAAPGEAGGPGGPRGGARGGGFGPQLPPEQQAEVDRITAALDAENRAVVAANSNLVVTTFSLPEDKDRIAKANAELAQAREAWATKASKLFTETQASGRKLSNEAIAVLVRNASGRGGRGFGPPGGSPGGPGGSERRGGRRGGPSQ